MSYTIERKNLKSYRKNNIVLIRTRDNIIFVKAKNLVSHIQSQLLFWKFKINTEEEFYYLETDEKKNILIKLLKYLDDENIQYKLDDELKLLLDQYYIDSNEFFRIKEIAHNYKNGNYNIKEFSNFITFVNKHISKHRILKDHQIKAAFHFHRLGNAANYSVPGSGKTTVVLTNFEKLKQEKKINTLFVVGPPSCFGPWRKEFKKTLGRNPDFYVFSGKSKNDRIQKYFPNLENKHDLYMTTFQTLMNDQDEVVNLFNNKFLEIFLVVDEAHYIKQVYGEWAKAVLKISGYAKCRCVLTGTPIPNHYSDVFNQFDFLWPNYELLDINTKIRINILESKKDDKRIKEILREKISPFFYRVRKRELGLIPQNFNPPILLKMNYYEKLIYDAISLLSPHKSNKFN